MVIILKMVEVEKKIDAELGDSDAQVMDFKNMKKKKKVKKVKKDGVTAAAKAAVDDGAESK